MNGNIGRDDYPRASTPQRDHIEMAPNRAIVYEDRDGEEWPYTLVCNAWDMISNNVMGRFERPRRGSRWVKADKCMRGGKLKKVKFWQKYGYIVRYGFLREKYRVARKRVS